MSATDPRHAPLDLSPDEFRRLAHRMVDHVADFLTTLPGRPVAPDTTPDALRALIGTGSVPRDGSDATALVDDAARLLVEHSTFNGHPAFFGYITAPAAPIGMIADLLASAVNPNCGAWQLSPIATEIERQTVRWIAELLGMPSSCGGLLVSGGNMANIVCAMAALRAKAGWNVREAGVAQAPLALYTSSETHTWVQKFADLSGLGTGCIRWVPVDDALALRMDDLARMIADDRAKGVRPFMVVGTAGSVSTGAVDPLPEIAQLCRDEELWFHVDGAYGAPAAMLPDASEALRGIALADSAAMDPHKWLYAPLEAGCAIVRDPTTLLDAFSFHPPYYRFGEAGEEPPTNFYEYGPQNSRGFRALKVWMALKQVGRAGYERMLADDIALARELYALAEAHDELEPVTQGLSITTFRYAPRDVADAEVDALNEALLARLQRAGTVFLSNAVIGGRFVLRACVVNFRSTSAEMQRVVEEVVRIGRALVEEKRKAE